MGMAKEFREFIARGNVIDLAVGVVIGAAFGKIVSSLVDGVIMPPITYAMSGVNLDEWGVLLGKDAKGADVKMLFGPFITSLLQFLMVAAVLFLVVRAYNRLRRRNESVAAEPTDMECPFCRFKIPLAATRCAHCTSKLPRAA